jgi:hypothetical protein
VSIKDAPILTFQSGMSLCHGNSRAISCGSGPCRHLDLGDTFVGVDNGTQTRRERNGKVVVEG